MPFPHPKELHLLRSKALALRLWFALNKWDAFAELGQPEQVRSVFVGFQKHLYSD